MADIGLSTASKIRAYRCRSGAFLTQGGQASTCASTSTIKLGQMVQFDIATETASHRLVQSSTQEGRIDSTRIAGIAAESDTSDGSTLSADKARPLSYYAADPGNEFLFPTNIAGTGSTLVGTGLALWWDSTRRIHYAYQNGSAAAHSIWVTEVPDPGDTNGLVVGRFQSTRVLPPVYR